jgi:hypothetical protein
MATVSDVVRRINARLGDLTQQLATGQWTDDERTPEWHGMQARSQLAYIAGLQEALKLIDDLQRDN